MKIRPVYWFVGVVLLLTVLLLWSAKKKGAEMQPDRSPIDATKTTNASQVAAESSNTSSATSVSSNAVPSLPPTDKGLQVQDGLATLNDAQIAFYGRLMDQFGSPVSGAQIAADVRIYNGVQSTVNHLKTVSDGNGFFQVQGGKGESLAISPKKEGYVLATTDTLFKYSYMYPNHFTSDPNTPTVVHMWKLQGAEPLVDISKQYKLPFSEKQLSFDLIAKEIVSGGGDVKITVHRPDGIISQQHPQNWNIDFEINGGGFVETSYKQASVTFAAPDADYQFNGTFGNNNGPDTVEKDLFIKSRDGKVFSKCRFSFRINNKPEDLMYVEFRGVANTNSSGNWEATIPR